LGDKVGAGKTLMIVALINQKKIVEPRDNILSNTQYVAMVADNIIEPIRTNLIIVPSKIIHQWVLTFKVSDMNVLKINNIRNFKNKETDELINVNDYDVIIVTDKKVKELINLFPDVVWGRIIIDEIDSIILPRYTFGLLKFGFLWLVTATHSALFNTNKPFLINVFRKMDYTIFSHILVKNNDMYVDKALTLPKAKRFILKCQTPPEYKILCDFVSPEIMSMVNSGNLDDAIKQLNCNEDTDENILQIITKNHKNELAAKKDELKFTKSQKNIPKDIRNHKIDVLEKRIKTLKTRIESIEEKIKSISKDICQICLGEFTKPCVTPCCQSIFCFECIIQATSVTRKCPICQDKIIAEKMQLINNKTKQKKSGKAVPEIKKIKDKFERLRDILKKTENEQTLIFSTFDNTFNKIENILKELHITSSQLKGSVVNTIKSFETGETKVLMLNARYAGAGLNLQCAKNVILFHRFKREIEEQVIGRAQRMGRKGRLNVYYLVHDGENINDLCDGVMENMEFEEIEYKNKKIVTV
jgi:SNF2 family DNA or RNA helicase